MIRWTRTLGLGLGLGCLLVILGLTACGGGASASDKAATTINRKAENRSPYVPHNDVEFKNYNRAQQLYDSPTTIIFCTTTWGNASAPLVTVPIQSKLTSSTTTYFNPNKLEYSGETGIAVLPARSVDGMYHPNPPSYRYGFTPGGQYVDFFNMPSLCSTAMTKFQRQQTKVSLSLDPSMVQAQKVAEAALAHGDSAGAQRALEAGLGNQ